MLGWLTCPRGRQSPTKAKATQVLTSCTLMFSAFWHGIFRTHRQERGGRNTILNEPLTWFCKATLEPGQAGATPGTGRPSLRPARLGCADALKGPTPSLGGHGPLSPSLPRELQYLLVYVRPRTPALGTYLFLHMSFPHLTHELKAHPCAGKWINTSALCVLTS